MWLFFRKEPKNLPKSFQKNIFHFINLQLEMWRILWIFFPKIIWTNLESISCVCVCMWQQLEIWVCFLFSQIFAVQLSNHVIWVPWLLMILVELVRFFTLLISVASQANYVAPTKSGPEKIMLQGRFLYEWVLLREHHLMLFPNLSTYIKTASLFLSLIGHENR